MIQNLSDQSAGTDKKEYNEAEILYMKDRAFEQGHFRAYFQPQYDHASGMIVGTEALARWVDPDFGVVYPNSFIPVFENSGDIVRLDLSIFNQACQMVRLLLDKGYAPVPISVNVTRKDILCEDFIDQMESIRKKYDVDSEYLSIEILETVAVENLDIVNAFIARLHALGYAVEMDDFGTGYSSLNSLKNMDIDLIKLDMEFIRSSQDDDEKGGIILSSVIRMASWLGIPVIAEGVDSLSRAEFLRSVGCNYVQGYLYAKPMPAEDYVKLMKNPQRDVIRSHLSMVEEVDSAVLFNPSSKEAQFFTHFVGPAAIFINKNDAIEFVRINKRFLDVLKLKGSEADYLAIDPMKYLDVNNQAILKDTLKKGGESCEVEECVLAFGNASHGENQTYVRVSLRMMGNSDEEKIYFAVIKNVTREIEQLNALSNFEVYFKQVTELLDAYFWEYDFETRDMRPCHRCRRDLGLPSVLKNYPEPVIESGFIPADYADFYRDWLEQLAGGLEGIEGIIPVTPDRVPFHFKYHTEFDAQGRPVKAYGSAVAVNAEGSGEAEACDLCRP